MFASHISVSIQNLDSEWNCIDIGLCSGIKSQTSFQHKMNRKIYIHILESEMKLIKKLLTFKKLKLKNDSIESVDAYDLDPVWK